jgi:hypothetical protein
VRHALQKVARASNSQGVRCFPAGQRQASLWIFVERIEQEKCDSRGLGKMPPIRCPRKDIAAPVPGGCSALSVFVIYTPAELQFEAM